MTENGKFSKMHRKWGIFKNVQKMGIFRKCSQNGAVSKMYTKWKIFENVQKMGNFRKCHKMEQFRKCTQYGRFSKMYTKCRCTFSFFQNVRNAEFQKRCKNEQNAEIHSFFVSEREMLNFKKTRKMQNIHKMQKCTISFFQDVRNAEF